MNRAKLGAFLGLSNGDRFSLYTTLPCSKKPAGETAASWPCRYLQQLPESLVPHNTFLLNTALVLEIQFQFRVCLHDKKKFTQLDRKPRSQSGFHSCRSMSDCRLQRKRGKPLFWWLPPVVNLHNCPCFSGNDRICQLLFFEFP